jgi:hypothetical protein
MNVTTAALLGWCTVPFYGGAMSRFAAHYPLPPPFRHSGGAWAEALLG